MAHMVTGPEAHFRGYMARLLAIIAGGKQIDLESAPSYADGLGDIYRNPFAKQETDKVNQTEEIKAVLLKRLKE